MWAGPSRAGIIENLMGQAGPGRETLKMRWAGPGRARPLKILMDRAGRRPIEDNMIDRAGPRPIT